MYGWLFCKNVNCSSLAEFGGKRENIESGWLYTKLLNKFYNDTVKDLSGYFLEGYVLNKKELMEFTEENDWNKGYKKLCFESTFPMKLRGSFSGFYFGKDGIKNFFVDHMGSKTLYFYQNKNQFIISSRLEWVVKILSENKIEYHFDEQAARYMMTYGFMLDESTFISEVKRVLPGQKVILKENELTITQYYIPTIEQKNDISEAEAIDLIDKAFRNAVRREFEKDKEYGYKHLVDLSGGLDSRMVTWVAHDMGYVKQTNFSYCKAEYLDFKISSKIARDLKHEYYFKQLDDFQWISELEEILRLNNGAALYSGITGGKDCLSNFNRDEYGIEHTGMLGDVILSCYATNAREAMQTPNFGLRQHSSKLQYVYDRDKISTYKCQEIMDFYTRGLLGMMSTYFIRQDYFEVASPFLDVDFVEICFSMPLKYRVKHNIYLKWINKCYKDATKYGWEKWAGVQPKKNMILVRNIAFVLRKIRRTLKKIMGTEISDQMNPIDYWYANDKAAQAYFQQYYNDNICRECFSISVRKDLKKLFFEGTASEKTQVLTVLGMANLYFK